LAKLFFQSNLTAVMVGAEVRLPAQQAITNRIESRENGA
jgi:hypothetical protein